MSGMRLANAPFLLRPAAKDYLWGGRRLNDDFSKNLAVTPLAESWECSTHPDGVSMVASGEYAGASLSEAIAMHPEWLGTHPLSLGLPSGQLPVLIKLIDAAQDLSVQVHPDDDYARKNENGQLGKTEFWYIMDARKDSKLVFGLKKDQTREKMQRAVQEGTLEKLVQKIPVKKNDVFFVPPGMVHAIGSGVLLAEVQENSNLTYRLFDYDRQDKNGRKRELHIDKALDVMINKKASEPRQPMRVLNYRSGVAKEVLGRCRYFQTERMLLNTERIRDLVHYQTGPSSFEALLCLDGCVTMNFGMTQEPVFRGDCIFIPANSPEILFHGVCQFLVVKG